MMSVLSMGFTEEFRTFLSEHGIAEGRFTPVPVYAVDADEAQRQQAELQGLVGKTSFVVEDRWRSRPEQTRLRILAHSGVFTRVYARNCELRRIDKLTAAAFLTESHDYADALCRYRYGLFLKHLTGEKSCCDAPSVTLECGTLVAVAEFSNLRNLDLDGTRSRSCQWIRYASLPGVRVSGGMGKLLSGLLNDVAPDDVMTYADLEWSDGGAYHALGFDFEGLRAPVLFRIDPLSWRRSAVGSRKTLPGDGSSKVIPLGDSRKGIPSGGEALTPASEQTPLWYRNYGSARYRLRVK